MLKAVLICISILSMYSALYAKEGSWRLHIRSATIVRGGHIHLKDIVDIVGTMPKEEWEAIASTILWESPKKLGVPQNITPITIRKKMKELLGIKELFCIYPTTLTVQRGGYIRTRKELEKNIQDTVLPIIKKQYSGAITISDFRLPEYMFIANENERIQIIPQKIQAGRSSVLVQSVGYKNTVEKMLTASFTVNIFSEVACSAENLSKNSSLFGKVQKCSRNIALLQENIWDSKNPAHFRTKRSVAKGDILYENMVERIPAISKGDIIQLQYIHGSIVLHTQASALTNASIGEHITVQSVQSSKKIYATVLNSKTVIVKK